MEMDSQDAHQGPEMRMLMWEKLTECNREHLHQSGPSPTLRYRWEALF